MPKQPQDHKSADFTHTMESGQAVTLPAFRKAMTFGRARRLRHLPEDEQVFALIEEICDEDQLAALDAMTTDETETFFQAWRDHSADGASLGE